jgi:hypothetical protein
MKPLGHDIERKGLFHTIIRLPGHITMGKEGKHIGPGCDKRSTGKTQEEKSTFKTR